MENQIFASFADPQSAENAVGALLDHGVLPSDLTLIRNESAIDHQNPALGITTTTAGDAGIGAAKGAVWGIGAGAIAAVAMLFVPGVGIVIGGGAFAAAMGAAAAAGGAGAMAGAVTGYLRDQGFEADEAEHYERIITSGGGILTVSVPSGDVDEQMTSAIIDKYAGTTFTKKHASPSSYLA